jgi:hypothetical protein
MIWSSRQVGMLTNYAGDQTLAFTTIIQHTSIDKFDILTIGKNSRCQFSKAYISLIGYGQCQRDGTCGGG